MSGSLPLKSISRRKANRSYNCRKVKKVEVQAKKRGGGVNYIYIYLFPSLNKEVMSITTGLEKIEVK